MKTEEVFQRIHDQLITCVQNYSQAQNSKEKMEEVPANSALSLAPLHREVLDQTSLSAGTRVNILITNLRW